MDTEQTTPAEIRAKLARHELDKEGLEQLAEALVVEWERVLNQTHVEPVKRLPVDISGAFRCCLESLDKALSEGQSSTTGSFVPCWFCDFGMQSDGTVWKSSDRR